MGSWKWTIFTVGFLRQISWLKQCLTLLECFLRSFHGVRMSIWLHIRFLIQHIYSSHFDSHICLFCFVVPTLRSRQCTLRWEVNWASETVLSAAVHANLSTIFFFANFLSFSYFLSFSPVTSPPLVSTVSFLSDYLRLITPCSYTHKSSVSGY